MMKDNKLHQDKHSSASGIVARVTFIVFAASALTLFIFNNPQMAWRVCLVALGFGGVVMVHELGHFLVAKAGGIRVEAFAIGFPPLVLGFRKLKKGIRVRLFPSIDNPGPIGPGDHETEYCIGLLPVGGFVKMLGQSDSGVVERSGDPCSYLNRPIWIRVAVVSAGVIFNALAAIGLFVGLFLHGVELAPPVVGQVVLNSPADIAGFEPGDRILEINGKDFIDYTSIILAGALSGDNKKVRFVVRHPDGGTETIESVAEKRPGDESNLKSFGIMQATNLTISRFIEEPNDIELLYKQAGFRPGDVITAFDGVGVDSAWQMDKLAEKTMASSAKLSVVRCWPAGSAPAFAQVTVPMRCMPITADFRREYNLADIYSMMPRLKVFAAERAPLGPRARIKNWLLRRVGKGRLQEMPPEPVLRKGDILLKVGDAANPTYRELREQTEAHKDKELSVAVLRKEQGVEKELTVSVRPRTDGGKNGRALLDIIPQLDMDRPVVGRTIDSAGGPAALPIPSGARITSVDGQAVDSFYDVVKILRACPGQRISIEYRTGDDGGVCGLTMPDHDAINARSEIAVFLPLENLKEVYRSQTAVGAVGWGIQRTWQFIAQSYLTLKKLITGNMPASSLTGPVGIVTISYKLAGQSLGDFLYFIGLISSCLAVMNLLPIPIVDGGVIVLLIIEKIKGGPLNEKVQQAIVYAGVALLLTVFLFITYNDILRLFFG